MNQPISSNGLAFKDKSWWSSNLLRAVAMSVPLMCIATYALAMYWFFPRSSEIDELGLFNPVYMKIHFGRMTYPVYGHFRSMFVHPPVRYQEVAALMRLGMTLPYAEEAVVCLLSLAIAAQVTFSRFTILSKLSLLSGYFSGLVWLTAIDGGVYSLRPDTQVALAWFLGLVLLQDGLVRDWNTPRLFAGAFMLTYASGLHYFGVVAFLGILYYAVTAFRRLSGVRRRRALASLAGGACCFGIPYVLLFVLPNWRDIVGISADVQAAGNWLSPITRHFAQYAYWTNAVSVPIPLQSILRPVLESRIPLFAAGAAMLALRPDLRGLAAASLPLTLFVFGYSRGKSAGYYLPELMIYFAGVAALVCSLLELLVSRTAPRRFALPIAAGLFVPIAGWATKGGYFEYAPALSLRSRLIAPMDIARACAKKLVGANAFIGGRIGLWYISGAQSWYDIAPDLLWRKDISSISIPEYFSRFDYIVEHEHMSNTTLNAPLQSLPSWYVSGVLKLQGFVFNVQHTNMNVLFFKTTSASKVAGYLVDTQTVSRFDQDPAGDFVFAARVCQFESWPAVNRFGVERFSAIYLPKAGEGDPARSILPAAKPGGAQSAVVTFVTTIKQFDSARAKLDAECGSLMTVTGRLTSVDVRELFAEWRHQERSMQFPQGTDDRIAARFAANVVRLPSFNLDHLTLAYSKAEIEGNRTKVVTTSAQPYSFAAAIELPNDGLPARGWIAVHERVVKGQIGLGVLDGQKNDFVARRFVDQHDGFETAYIPLSSGASALTFVIENGDTHRPSTIQIDDIRIIQEGANPIDPVAGKPVR